MTSRASWYCPFRGHSIITPSLDVQHDFEQTSNDSQILFSIFFTGDYMFATFSMISNKAPMIHRFYFQFFSQVTICSPRSAWFRTRLQWFTYFIFNFFTGDDMFATFSMISNKAPMIHGFSRIYLYSFVMLFIYVILSLFIAIIMDT